MKKSSFAVVGCRRHQVLLLDRNRRLIGVEMAYTCFVVGQPGMGRCTLYKGGVPGVDRAGDAGARWMLQRASGGRSARRMSANSHDPVSCIYEIRNEEGCDLEEVGADRRAFPTNFAARAENRRSG
jgi:hypothetical protein